MLLVEDNPVNQAVASRLLAKRGVACDIAENGQVALDRAAAKSYDVIFMDCQMPLVDGYEATRAIRRREASSGGRTPIIAMTANAMAGDRERCLDCGMDDYISKPLSVARLQTVLEAWLPEHPA